MLLFYCFSFHMTIFWPQDATKNRGWTSQRLLLRQSRDYRINSTSKIRASIFMSKIEFFAIPGSEKFSNLLYNRVMELYPGFCAVLWSYELWVVMENEFYSKKFSKYKFAIKDYNFQHWKFSLVVKALALQLQAFRFDPGLGL